jgi:hypothetical protein
MSRIINPRRSVMQNMAKSAVGHILSMAAFELISYIVLIIHSFVTNMQVKNKMMIKGTPK